MGRKRLLTLLAALVAAMGLQAAPAMAQSLELPGVSVSDDDGLEVELDVEVTDDLALKPDVKVGSDDTGPTVELDGTAKVGDTEVDLGEVTQPPSEPLPDPAPPETPEHDPQDDADASAEDDQLTAPTVEPQEPSEEQQRRGHKVAASGGVANWTPQRRAQFEAFRALRDYDFGFGTSQASVVPGVELAPRRVGEAGDDEVGMLVYDEPQVAPGLAEAAPEPAGSDAVLASAAERGPMQDVPVPLQVLTGMLIAGSALAWHLTRRELGWALSGLRTRG